MTVAAVIFDLDGVLLDSEQLWNQAKESVVGATGGQWRDDAPQAMMGLSSPEWSEYLRDQLGVPRAPETINREVVARVEDSSNGLRAAAAADMAVIALPNPHYPPDEDALGLAEVVLDTLDELTPALVKPLA